MAELYMNLAKMFEANRFGSSASPCGLTRLFLSNKDRLFERRVPEDASSCSIRAPGRSRTQSSSRSYG